MKTATLLLFFLVAPFITHAQNKAQPAIDSLANNFLKYLSSFDKEKILLQTDRQIYATGETIYFKAYLIDSITNQLRTRPKKLYVDLVNKKDQLFGQLLLNASNLQTSGEFILNDSLKTGYYWIRAYNEKMIAEDLSDITVKPVFIVNMQKNNFRNEVRADNENADSPSLPIVKVFPEGGNIISGISSTVALKVTDENGYPRVVQGMVKDNADSVCAQFSTNTSGLAKFSFYPIWYHRYSINILNNGKYDSVAVLPPVNFFGGQLAVLEQNDSEVKVRVTLEDSIYSKDYTTYLIALSGDSICYSARGKGMYDAAISLHNFFHGVCRLLLFNSKEQLLSERDIFIKKQNYNISVHTDKNNYGPRENVKLDISVTDKNDKPLLAGLAVSVTDMHVCDTTLNDGMEDSLQNFSQEDADLVMLTNKNKYAHWTAADTSARLQTANDSERITPEISAEKNDYSTFTISGTVLNQKHEPVAQKIVTIFSNKNYMLLDVDTTDADGKFRFYVPDFSDSTKFLLQVSDLNGKKEDGYIVDYDPVYMPHFSTPSYLKKKFAFDKKLHSILSELYDINSVYIGTGNEWLKTVVLNAKKRYKKPVINYDESKRVSPFSHIITSDMVDNGSNRLLNALLMIPGVRSTGNSISIGGPVNTEDKFAEPMLILNGSQIDTKHTQVHLLEYLNSIPANTIDFVEVLTGPEGAMYGVEGGNGVIIINTKISTGRNENKLKGLPSFYRHGFNSAQPFIMPDYNDIAMKNSNLQDLRATIYWDGNIVTNLNGKTSVNFFTADKRTTYLVTVTGVTANGDKIFKRVTISRK